MKTFLVVLFVVLGLFCLFSSGMYVYMTMIGYEGGTYIKPAIQTGGFAIMCVAAIFITVSDIV